MTFSDPIHMETPSWDSHTPLLLLLAVIDELPLLPSSVRGRRPWQYAERLFLKAWGVMVVRHSPTIHALVAVPDQPEMAAVRAASGAPQDETARTSAPNTHHMPPTAPCVNVSSSPSGEWHG